MSPSVQTLLDENFKLKSQLHMYEQYQAVLRIQKNLAVSLGKTVTLPEAFDMILETVTHTQGVKGAGVLVRTAQQDMYKLVAHTGIPRHCVDRLHTVDTSDPEFSFLLRKGHYPCNEHGVYDSFGKDAVDSCSLGVYPVLRDTVLYAVLLVFCEETFSAFQAGVDLLDAISGQIDGVIERVERDDRLCESLNEKEILLKEVHHRVKNNLAMISSFISLQEAGVADKNALSILQSLQQKIEAVVGIYNLLYRSGNVRSIRFHEYGIGLLENMIRTLADEPDMIRLEHVCEDMELSIDQSITIGLILSELTTNSLKYAFPDGRGVISLKASVVNGSAVISYTDSGHMFPKNFDLHASTGLGERIVLELAAQLKGRLQFDGEQSLFTITFPLDLAR
ncbi:MAG: sensor histidine kinase [Spirochaetales bacterium]|nr:sensor histidine kinase [Spirochaetales bacterium]